VKWDDKDLALCITNTHKAVQMLHHVHTFDFDCVGLIVGDDNGDIMCGTFVEFNDEIKAACSHVLSVLCDFVLKWLCKSGSKSASMSCDESDASSADSDASSANTPP